MLYRVKILFCLLIFINSCNEPDDVSPVLFESLIGLEKDIREITIEDDHINIRSDDAYIKFSLTGELLENREVPNINYGIGDQAFRLIKGGYMTIERIFNDFVPGDPEYFMVHQHSYSDAEIVKTDTFWVQNPDIWDLGNIILANNHELPNNDRIGVYFYFSDIPHWTTYSIELHSKESYGKYNLIGSYTLDDILVQFFHPGNFLYAYKDLYLLFGNFDFVGDSYTKDFYIINPDGSYVLAHSKENDNEETEIFEYKDRLYVNYKSKDKCRILSSVDLKKWDTKNLNYPFDYLGSAGSILIGKVDGKVGKLSLENNDFYELETEIDLSDCNKVVDYKDYIYFIKKNQIIRIESDKISFTDTL